MENNDIKNDGIKILSSMLNKWRKENNSNNMNYIFFPKFIETVDGIYMVFPVYEELDKKTAKLVSKINFSLEKNNLIDEETLHGNVKVELIKNLDFENKKYYGQLSIMAEIFYLSMNLKRMQPNEAIYFDAKKTLKQKINEYNIMARENGLLECIGEDELEKFQTEKRKAVSLFEKNEKEIDMPDLSGNSEIATYAFEFNAKNGLKYISDEMLEISYEFIRKGNMSITLDDKNKFRIKSNIISLCGLKMNTNELYHAVKKNEKINEKAIYAEKISDFNFGAKQLLDSRCEKCPFQKCPKKVAAYILYLKNNGLLREKLLERKNFRKNLPEINNEFDFIWNIENGLKEIPNKTFEFCNELVNRKFVYVENILNANGKMVIRSAFSCNEYKVFNEEIANIPETANEYVSVLERGTDCDFDFCNTYICRLTMCVYVIAGYIYYLIRSGKENQIIEDRKYYEKNKAEIDEKITALKERKLLSIENEKENIAVDLKDYKDTVENIDSLIDMVLSRAQNDLHCVITGEDILERKKFITKIKELLIKSQKIKSTDVINMSLQNLASGSAYTWSGQFSEDKGLADMNGISYYTEEAIKYPELKEGKLYILNGINEFISDCNTYLTKGSGSYHELRNKQYNHVIELITKMTFRNYIIIECSEKELEKLLELDNRIKFIYQSNIFKIPDLSLDEMFDVYLNNIKTDLIEELRTKKEEYKGKFREWIGMNKNFIPFSDRELVKYLVMYANAKDKIVFPENIYKKETVDESLKNIIGLQTVKDKVKEFEKYMLFKVRAKANNLDINKTNMHMIFTGNPGTGKTTVARIMAKMLFDLGIIKENKLVEVERKDLVAEYTGQTAPKTSEVIQKAMGGVLFIDEAYTLATERGSKDFASEAIATLIKAMEDNRDKFVVIFAGYKDEMKSFIDSNPGIASRIGYTFDFPDYTPEELEEMFYLKMKNSGFICEEEIHKPIKDICEYYSKKKAFGNGRFVDKLVQEVIMKHAINDFDDIKLISAKEIPSIEEMNNEKNLYNKSTLNEMLENIIGLDELKNKIKEFEKYVTFLKKAQNKKINMPSQNLHMIFTGNPGTGKTTIARVIAKILFEIGIIHENKLIEVERKDLVAEYIGQTATKTSEVIERAMGGVLFIDEAYTLSTKDSKDFSYEAIATIIKAMEDNKEQLVVIFAGYKDEMKSFVDSNPGIASRIGYKFDFPDYTSKELVKIFNVKMKKAGFEYDDLVDEKVEDLCEYYSQKKAFGNGRFVDKLVQETIMKHAINCEENIEKISYLDIPTIEELNNSNTKYDKVEIDKMLEEIVGMTEVKKKVKEFEEYVRFIKEAKNHKIVIPNQNLHMIFTGNPGTGKTTMARIVAKILFEIGIIHENKLIEVERKDLIAEYVGQTALKTNEVIEKAMGGVLFIDEAYSLTPKNAQNDFGSEAIATIIKAMEDNKNQLVVIFAGYRDEMQDFVSSNSGIASRIGYTFDFPDYSAEELLQIFDIKVKKMGITLTESANDEALKIMKYFCNVENIGNGRFVDKVIQEMLMKYAKNKEKVIGIIDETSIPTINEMTKIVYNGRNMIDVNLITYEAQKRTAVHEVGHAITRLLLFKNSGIKKITINAEGTGTLGYVLHNNFSNGYTKGKQTLLNEIKTRLAGMAAEQVYFGEFENGNTSDLESATNIANLMITKFGMSSLGFGQIAKIDGEMANIVQKEINRMLDECFKETVILIENNKAKSDDVVEYLLEHKEINEEELLKVFGSNSQ